MTLIGGLIGLVSRFAGQILNTTLGWATLLLFGKVPQSRQFLLLVIVFGSLVWIALIVGVLNPQVGSLLVAAIPLSDALNPEWIRLAMLAGVVAVPFLIGVAAAFVSTDTTRRGPAAILKSGLRGYPFAAALTLMLVLLALVGIGRKIRSLSHRWQDAHIPMMVKPGGYDAVLADVERGLDDAGLDMAPHDAGVLLSGPPKLLDAIAGRGLGELVPDRLMILAGKNIEVLVYPSDLAISGSRDKVAAARAALASRVSSAPAYLTTSAEAQKVEDLLDSIRDRARETPPQATITRLREVDDKLSKLTVEYAEWEILYRLRLQLERDARASLDQGLATTEDQTGVVAPERDGRQLLPTAAKAAIAVGGAALVAADVALQIAQRRSGDVTRDGR